MSFPPRATSSPTAVSILSRPIGAGATCCNALNQSSIACFNPLPPHRGRSYPLGQEPTARVGAFQSSPAPSGQELPISPAVRASALLQFQSSPAPSGQELPSTHYAFVWASVRFQSSPAPSGQELPDETRETRIVDVEFQSSPAPSGQELRSRCAIVSMIFEFQSSPAPSGQELPSV